MNSSSTILQRVGGFVRRKRLFLAGRTLALVGIVCVLWAGVAITGDVFLAFPGWGRWLACAALFAVFGAGVLRYFLLPAINFREHQALREIENSQTEVGQMLRTSAQLQHAADASRTGFSPALSEALVKQAEDLLTRTNLNQLIPWRRVLHNALRLLLLILLFAIGFWLWDDFRTGTRRLLMPAASVSYTRVQATASAAHFERGDRIVIRATASGRLVERATLLLREDDGQWERLDMTTIDPALFTADIADRDTSFEFEVRAGDGRSRRQWVQFIDPPVIEQVRFHFRYPDYTHIEPREFDRDDVAAVEGTEVGFHFRISHPLREAFLRVNDGPSFPARIEAAEVWVAHTLTPGPNECILEGVDDEELPLKPVIYTFHGLTDELPEVSIVEPREGATVDKLAELTVRIRARDDYGLAQLGLVLAVDGREETLFEKPFEEATVLSAAETTLLVLEKYPLTFRSNVKLYAYARDHKPGREERGVSRLVAIDIRAPEGPSDESTSEQQPAAHMSEEQAEQHKDNIVKLEDAIGRQRALLSDTLRVREERPRDRDAMAEIAQQEEQLADAVGKLDETIAAGSDIEGPAPRELLQQAVEHMETAVRDLRDARPAHAFRNEDQALSSMLQMREEMIRQLQEHQQQPQPQKTAEQQDREQREQREELEKLAQEAERLAREERDIGEQIAALQERVQAQRQQRPDDGQPPRDADADDQARDPAAEQGAQQNRALANGQQDAAPQNEHADAPGQASAREQQQDLPQDADPAGQRANDQQMRAATEQQGQAVADADRLLARMQEHPQPTRLAQQRMAQAGQTMAQAEQNMRDGRTDQARPRLQQAENELEQLAEHVRGLDPRNLAEMLEAARAKAERAAQELDGQDRQANAAAQPQQGQPQQGQEQGAGRQQGQSPQEQQDQHGRQQPAQQQAQQEQGQNGQQPHRQTAQQQQDGARSQPGQPPGREELAQDAETVADWVHRSQQDTHPGLEKMQDRLRQLRDEVNLDEMAEDLRYAQKQQDQGRDEQAREADRDAAIRFRQLARALERERQRLVQSHIERLANAETEARELQEQLEKPQPPQPSKQPARQEGGAPGGHRPVPERIEDLADELRNLNDQPLEQIGERLREQLLAERMAETSHDGFQVPKTVAETTLSPAVRRLQFLIEEIVRKEILLNRDDRVPEKYTRVVERYFKALSDDVREP